MDFKKSFMDSGTRQYLGRSWVTIERPKTQTKEGTSSSIREKKGLSNRGVEGVAGGALQKEVPKIREAILEQ